MLEKKGGSRAYGASTSGKQTNQASVAEEAVEEPSNILSVNPSRGKGRTSDVWLLDSGCTYYMYLRKEWFSTYEPFEGGIVLMGNNVACKTIGLGSVHIKIFEGRVQTLKDMRHIPD